MDDWREVRTHQSKREEEHHDKEQAQLFSFCFFLGTEMHGSFRSI
jgi:hypothetical protein